MNWDDAKVFLAVLRHRSLSGAASVLGCSHSTVRRRLSALEASVGAPLFVTSTDLLEGCASKPVLIAWPMNDTAFGPEILEELWLPDFPAAEVHRIEPAGHYIQEDAHERVIPKLLTFLER
ncbi:MAG: LysR family transcriptional regulator [Myxococcota bacterium]